MKYVLDTDICIYIIKKHPDRLIQKIAKTKLEYLAISSITVAEMEYGVQKSMYPEKNKLALTKFLVPFCILEFDESDAAEYGRIRANIESIGKPIGPYDLLIAAQAKSKGLTVVTNNDKEFRRIKGLKVENWTK